MAYIRTPTGLQTDDGTNLPYAKQDTPSVGGAVIAGAPAATLTNPQDAAAQSPTGAASQSSAAPSTQATSTPARSTTQRSPSSGVSKATDDALIRAKADEQVQAEEGNQAVKSPTALVLDYLTKQGLPRTSENVRLALEANARDPSTIKGLVNQEPPAATAQDTRPNAPSGGGRNLPTPPVPPTGATPSPTVPATVTNSTTSSGLDPSTIAALVLAASGAGGASLVYGLNRMNRTTPNVGDANLPVGPTETVAEPAGRVEPRPNPGRVVDVSPNAIEPPSPVSSAITQAVEPAPEVKFRGPRNAQTAAEAAAQFEAARKAAAAARAARGLRLY